MVRRLAVFSRICHRKPVAYRPVFRITTFSRYSEEEKVNATLGPNDDAAY